MRCEDTGEQDFPIEHVCVRMQDDHSSGRIRPLGVYLAMAPGHDRAIAQEYLFWTDDQEADTVGVAVVEPGVSVRKNYGKYRVLRQLGAGGQGQVFLAKDGELGRVVALKVLSPSADMPIARLLQLRREAEITASLDDPTFCTIYDVSTDDPAFIAMRYVPGKTLEQLIETAVSGRGAAIGDGPTIEIPTPPADVQNVPSGEKTTRPPVPGDSTAFLVRALERVSRALERAHAKLIVHRDIKPSNIMISSDGTPVILDFGMARDARRGSTIMAEGAQIGTPHYMAPEQVRGETAAIGPATDVWALGVCLYRALTLEYPFNGTTIAAIWAAVVNQEPVPPRQHRSSISRDLETIVLTALAKETTQRYRSAAALADDLAAYLHGEPIRARPVSSIGRIWRWSRRNGKLAASLATIVVLVVGALLVVTVLNMALRRSNSDLADKTDEAVDNLAKFTQLSGAKKTSDLRLEAENDLWPARPHMIPRFESWLVNAREEAQRLPAYRDALAKLDAAALPISSDIDRRRDENLRRKKYPQLFADLEILTKELESVDAVGESAADARVAEKAKGRRDKLSGDIAKISSDPRMSERCLYELPDFEDTWRRSVLSAMIGEVAALEKTIAEIETRLAKARSLAEATANSNQWSECIKSIRSDPRFNGLDLRPQIDLLPIGVDPTTQLWEFLHVPTGEPPTRENGRWRITAETGMILVLLPGGSFSMGAVKGSDEQSGPNIDQGADAVDGPVHVITLKPFFMSKYETTQAQWKRMSGRNPSYYTSGRNGRTEACPVEDLSWFDARLWLQRFALDLPTEAQWEYAARAGTTTRYVTGTDERSLEGYANLLDLAAKRSDPKPGWNFIEWLDDGFVAHGPVDGRLPNRFGLHDVTGNVWEWCLDRFGSYTNPVRPGTGERIVRDSTDHVARGGACNFNALQARVAVRFKVTPTSRNFLGVRAARAIE